LPLGDKDTLLSFEVLRDEVILFVVEGKNKRLKVREIPVSRKEVSSMVTAYRRFLDGNYNDDDALSIGVSLCDTLLRKSNKRFVSDGNYIVIRDDVLAELPFESLPLKMPKQRNVTQASSALPSDVKYWGREVSITYAPSLQAFKDKSVGEFWSAHQKRVD
jgi:hypothetical protein